MEDINAISDSESDPVVPRCYKYHFMNWPSHIVTKDQLEKEETELKRDRKELETRAEEWKGWFEAVGDTSQDVGIKKTNL
jgi:hypothetical protein